MRDKKTKPNGKLTSGCGSAVCCSDGRQGTAAVLPSQEALGHGCAALPEGGQRGSIAAAAAPRHHIVRHASLWLGRR